MRLVKIPGSHPVHHLYGKSLERTIFSNIAYLHNQFYVYYDKGWGVRATEVSLLSWITCCSSYLSKRGTVTWEDVLATTAVNTGHKVEVPSNRGYCHRGKRAWDTTTDKRVAEWAVPMVYWAYQQYTPRDILSPEWLLCEVYYSTVGET